MQTLESSSGQTASRKTVLNAALRQGIISLNRFSRGQAHARAHSPFTNVTLYNCFRPHSRPEVPFHSWIGHNGGFTRLLRTPASRHAPATSPPPSHSHSLPPLSFPYLSFPFPFPLLSYTLSLFLSFFRFLVLSRTRTHAHTTHKSPTVQFFASLSPCRFHFIASSPLLRSLVLSRPFVINRATLYEQQKGPLLVKPSHTFSYTSNWFFQHFRYLDMYPRGHVAT